MGLFDFLNKKPAGPNMKDLVWMNKHAKLQGCLNLARVHTDAVFISWFSQTQDEFKQYVQDQHGVMSDIRSARTVSPSHIENKKVFFLEHYPLRNKEEELIAEWKVKEVYVLNSLDEPLFENFGGQNIMQLMQKMGMQEEESMENTMISKSIENAQRKIAQKLIVENSASSSADWFKRNIIN